MPSWPDNSFYFLTTSTFQHKEYFNSEDKKQIILDQLEKAKQIINFPLYAYSIAVNHFHLLFYLKYGLQQQRVKQFINGGTSFVYNRKFLNSHDKLWGDSYTLIVKQKIFWRVWGYITGNLLKHKEVSSFTELMNNKFSCCSQLVKKDRKEFVKDQIAYSMTLNLDNKDGANNFITNFQE